MIALLATGAFAQEDRPQIFPGERKPVHKQDLGPRAVAVLQLGAKGRSSLVPIAILINGKFWDASVYKADPVPMALDSGTVYEVERSGSSEGLFTVNGALHRTVVNAPNPWLGTGSWVPNGTVVVKTTHKAEITPVGLETNDEPPHLTRSNGEAQNNTQSAPATKPASAPEATSKQPPSAQPSSSTPSAQPSSSPSSNPPQTGSAGSTQTSSAQTGSNQPSGPKTSTVPSSPGGNKPGDTKSTESSATETKTNQASVPASDSGASEENRPRLRRGQPTETLPSDDDIEGYSKPGTAGSSPTSPTSPSSSSENKAKADLPNVQLIPAISDAGGPEPHSYTFEWAKDEETQRQQQMTAVAKEQLRAYLKAQAKATITPEPARGARRRTKPEEPVLENVRMTAYDLWTSNQPVIVFSAEAHMPPSSSGAPSDDQAGLQFSILLVDYPDIYNNLHTLYAGITDKYHLDVTPRLDLVDAVDADGDGFGELLFRETSDAGTGWVIYRATADKLWKMFDSLNPE